MTPAADRPALTLDPPPAWVRDPAIRASLTALEAVGLTARVVGGAVRDAVRAAAAGAPMPAVADLDLATPARPEDTIRIAEALGFKAIPTGLKHGTVTVVAQGQVMEVTTLREDVETDGRHATVRFTDRWADDARRRDFTMNALYADAGGRVFDPLGTGIADARSGHVRFIGDPAARIAEDRLRVYRYFRFLAQLGSTQPAAAETLAADAAAGTLAAHAAAETFAAIAAAVPDLDRLAVERVWRELRRLLEAAEPIPALRLMARTGVAATLPPSAADGDCPPPSLNIDRLARLVDRLPAVRDAIVRLAALIPAPADALAMRFRLSNAERDRLATARAGRAALDPAAGPPDEKSLRILSADLGKPVVDAVALAAADAPEDQDREGWREAMALAAGLSPPVFPIGGRDVLALGVPHGEAVGRLLDRVRAWWLADGAVADRADCLAILAKLVQSDKL